VGILTLSQLESEILAGLGNRQDIPTSRVVNILNLAQSRITRSYDFSEMATVAFANMQFTSNPANDKYLVPPPLTKTIHSFVLLDTSAGLSSMGQSRKVIEKPWRWFDRRFPAPEWNPPGWPQFYKRWGNVIVMQPAPYLPFTAELSYTTHAVPFDINTPNQVSQFDNKDDLLISYSLAYFFKTLGRTDRAAYFEELSTKQLEEAIERDDTRPDIDVSLDERDNDISTSGPYWANPEVARSP